jgi:hypothetical protein
MCLFSKKGTPFIINFPLDETNPAKVRIELNFIFNSIVNRTLIRAYYLFTNAVGEK